MNYVLASLASGPDVKTINKRVVTFSGSSMPDTITPTTGFPMADQEIVSWTDSNNGNAVYIVGQAISLEGKNLPLCLTANWQPKKQTEITGYFSNNGTPYGMGIDGCSKKIELAQDNTFPIPGDSLYERFKAFFPEGSVITGWKDASGKFYELNAHIPYEELYGLTSFELYAQWTIPAPVKYYLNTNTSDDSESSDATEVPEGTTITMGDPEDTRNYTNMYGYIASYPFLGWSVNKRFPLIDSDFVQNENGEMDELKDSLLQVGDSYQLTDEKTTFYAVWGDSGTLTSYEMLTVNYQLGDDDENDAAKKTRYYLKGIMDSYYNEEYDDWYYRFPLPSMESIFPEWNDLPANTIKYNYWIIDNNENGAEVNVPGHTIDILSYYSGVYTLKATIKIPIVQYYDGGEYYGGTEYSAESIMSSDAVFEQYIYAKTWPLPEEFTFDVWEPSISDYEDDLFASSLSHDYGVDAWTFTNWVDKETGDTYLPSGLNGDIWEDFSDIPFERFPLQLEARWKSPTEANSITATPISSIDDLKKKVAANPFGTFSLEKNLTFTSSDMLSGPILGEDFNGTFYGNGLTITFAGQTSSLFGNIGSSGTIQDLNISGVPDTLNYNQTLDVMSMLCQVNNGTVNNCNYRKKDSFPTASCLLGGYTTGNSGKYTYCGIEEWDSTSGWVTYTGNDAPALTKQVTAGGNPNIQSGTSFTGYPENGTMPTNIYYAGSFEATRYIAFLGLETPLIDNTTIEMISHSRDFDFWCTPAANIYNNPQAEYTVSSYLTLGNFGANADNYLTADVIKTESGNTSTVVSGVVIQSITRDGVYLKYTYDYTYYDCFLFTPRGLFNMVNGNYNPGNRMPSPILCSGQISKDAITQTINTITKWE